MSERQIDEAIDQAVRDLMNVDADSAFRARVVERLRKPKSRAPFWRQLSVVTGAIGVAAVAIILVRDVGDVERPAVEPRPASAASAAAPQAAVEPPMMRHPAPIATPSPTLSFARRAAGNPTQQISRGGLVATVAVANAGVEAPTVVPAGDVEPLSGISPIELTPIAQAPIITTDIAIAPIAPPGAIVIAPVDPPTDRK